MQHLSPVETLLRHLSTAVKSAALLANAAACVVEMHAAMMLTSKSPWGRVAGQCPRPRLEASVDISLPQVARWPMTFLHDPAETETLTSHRVMKRGGSAPCNVLSAAMMRMRTGRARMRMRTRQHFAPDANAPRQLLIAVLSVSLSANGAASAPGMRVQHTTHNATNAREREIRIPPGSIVLRALAAVRPIVDARTSGPAPERVARIRPLHRIFSEQLSTAAQPRTSLPGDSSVGRSQAVHRICFERVATQSCPRA